MQYQPKKGSRHGLDAWLPSWMNSGIYTNEACTLFSYTQLTICTQSNAFPTLINVGYNAITGCIQFECVTMQLWIEKLGL